MPSIFFSMLKFTFDSPYIPTSSAHNIQMYAVIFIFDLEDINNIVTFYCRNLVGWKIKDSEV